MANKAASLRSVWIFGLRFHRTLGLKRILLLHGTGTLAAVLYALGIALMWPVIAILSGTASGSTGAMLARIQAVLPAHWSHNMLLYVLGGAVASIFVVRMACQSFFYAYSGERCEAYAGEIRRALMETYARGREVAPSQHARSTVLYLNGQIQQLNSFHWGMLASCSLAYLVAFIVIANIIISPAAFLGALVVIAILAPILQPLFRRTIILGDDLFAHYHAVLRKMNDYIEGFDTLTTLNVRKDIARQVDDASAQTTGLHSSLGAVQGIVSGMPEVLIGFFMLGWIVIAGDRHMDVPLLAVAAYSTVRLLGTFNQLNEKLNELLKLKKAPEDIYDFLDQKIEGVLARPTDGERRMPPRSSVAAIQFRDAGVAIGDMPLVEGVTVALTEPGLYQFSGPNGSGKSTALRALVGLLPYSGSILIDGCEAKELSRADISSLVSYHGQDNFLLEGTVLENLLLGAHGKTEQDLHLLVHQMKLERHPFLARGFDEMIAEGASNLSGGERQILCILRTLLRDTPIYVLDEFTNHLSRHVAAAVMNYLKGMQYNIVIVVSHSAADFAKMDIRFDHGRMLDAVTPGRLARQNLAVPTISEGWEG